MSNSGVQQLTRKQKDLREAFKSSKSKSVDEMLKKFKQMKPYFEESDLGIECWMLAQELCRKGRHSEQVLFFGKRALKIFLTNADNNIGCSGKLGNRLLIEVINTGAKCTYYNHKSALFIASLLNLLGCTSLDMKRYDESLSYLNWGNRNLNHLLEDDEESRCDGNCVLNVLDGNQVQLYNLKLKLGKREDAIVHGRKLLEIKEKTMEEGCVLLGHVNKMVSDVYWMDRKFEESLPFALKAVEIYTKHVGDDDVVEKELLRVRRNLGAIYGVLGEEDKALEQARLSLIGLKSVEFSSHSDWLSAQMEVANRLIALGRNEEGIEAFAFLLLFVEIEENEQARACSFTCMARGYCNLGKFSDARKHMKMAQMIFEKKKMMISPIVVATAFEDMSKVYEEMKEYESAISYLWKSVAVPELPEKNLIASSSRLFSLISVTGSLKKGKPYLDEVIERLKDRLGPDHREVAYGYTNLGVAYLKSEQVKLAVKFFEKAKDIMDAIVGPHHLDSVRASQVLSVSYAGIGRYHRAIEIQEKLVSSLKSMVPIEQKYLDEAIMHLNELKERVADPTWSETQSEDVDDLSATILKCDISEEGKVE